MQAKKHAEIASRACSIAHVADPRTPSPSRTGVFFKFKYHHVVIRVAIRSPHPFDLHALSSLILPLQHSHQILPTHQITLPQAPAIHVTKLITRRTKQFNKSPHPHLFDQSINIIMIHLPSPSPPLSSFPIRPPPPPPNQPQKPPLRPIR